MFILRTILAVLAIIVVGLAGFWYLAPREPVDTRISFDASKIDVGDPDRFLAREEADIPNLRPNARKEIVWAYPASRARTPLAIVYVHGYSADKNETRPLADEVASALGANLFYTRLTGHGRDAAALEQTSVNDWLNDLAEAVAIGRTIGNRVVVIGTSTGGTLAAFGASLGDKKPQLMRGVAGLVLISPNFRIRNRGAFLLDMPLARDILPWFIGATHGFKPLNERMGLNWTTTYPVGALVPMAALVRAARSADYADVDLPVLALFSPDDEIVDPQATDSLLARWGGPHRAVEVPVSGDPSNHIIAGDIVSPQTTASIAARIVDWIRQLPAPKTTTTGGAS